MAELLTPTLPEDTAVRGGSADGWTEEHARATGLPRVGQTLLRAAFRRFRDLGLDVVSVATDSRTGARGVFERAGMSVTWAFTRMTLPL